MFRNRLTRKDPRSSADTDINLTPMLDVVFILLIFFIITASFVQETGLNVSLSSAESTVLQETAIRVSIDSRGEIGFEGQIVDIRTLQSRLKKMYLENPQRALTIYADKASNNEALVRVLDLAHRVGIENIAIAAEVDE